MSNRITQAEWDARMTAPQVGLPAGPTVGIDYSEVEHRVRVVVQEHLEHRAEITEALRQVEKVRERIRMLQRDLDYPHEWLDDMYDELSHLLWLLEGNTK